jgi:uncharacterized protein YciI
MSPTYVYRLIPPRPTFDLDMTDDEREVMGRHAHYWGELFQTGKVVVYGPVRDATGSYGIAVVEANSEDEVRAIAAADPVATSGLARIEIGTMVRAFVRTAIA